MFLRDSRNRDVALAIDGTKKGKCVMEIRHSPFRSRLIVEKIIHLFEIDGWVKLRPLDAWQLRVTRNNDKLDIP